MSPLRVVLQRSARFSHACFGHLASSTRPAASRIMSRQWLGLDASHERGPIRAVERSDLRGERRLISMPAGGSLQCLARAATAAYGLDDRAVLTIVHAGRILEGGSTVPLQGIPAGETVYVFEKAPPPPPNRQVAGPEPDAAARLRALEQRVTALEAARGAAPRKANQSPVSTICDVQSR